MYNNKNLVLFSCWALSYNYIKTNVPLFSVCHEWVSCNLKN